MENRGIKERKKGMLEGKKRDMCVREISQRKGTKKKKR